MEKCEECKCYECRCNDEPLDEETQRRLDEGDDSLSVDSEGDSV